MEKLVRECAEKSGFFPVPDDTEWDWEYRAENSRYEVFAANIVQECLNIIKQYPIPVGNSPAGELAAEWTYTALEQIRDTIKETFEIKNECANS